MTREEYTMNVTEAFVKDHAAHAFRVLNRMGVHNAREQAELALFNVYIHDPKEYGWVAGTDVKFLNEEGDVVITVRIPHKWFSIHAPTDTSDTCCPA